MKRFCVIIAASAALAGLACSDEPTIPVADPAVEPDVLTLPELVVSNALSASAASVALSGGTASAGGGTVAYVSLPPGTVPDMVSVRIRNLTDGSATPTIPVVEGGFDPVSIPAAAGDELELVFTDGEDATSVAHATVAERRPPTVVRTNPPRGRTDVALSVQPRVVFSEPIDPETLAGGVRLLTAGTGVVATVDLLPDEPWIAELVPASDLEPGTTYELQVTTEIRDLDGDALEEEARVDFRTDTPTDTPAAPAALAIVSGNDQPGKAGVPLSDPFVVRVTDADGRGVEGVQVAWNVASGEGQLDFQFHGDDYLCDSIDGCTDALGRSYARLVPSTIGTTTVTAEVEGLEGSAVTFTTNATIMVIRFGQDLSVMGGQNSPPEFRGPHGTADVTVPVGTPVEWWIWAGLSNLEAWSGEAHIVSTSEPPGGEPFDFGVVGSCWEGWWGSPCDVGIYFDFVPNVAGTWEFEDLLSGATGTLMATEP
jgi:hypothetical protein